MAKPHGALVRHVMKASSRSGVGKRHGCTALVLQGGGALGAYQAGVYEALGAAGHALDWVAGVSIGAINAALIAGNPPDKRVERLSEFWHLVSSGMGPVLNTLSRQLLCGHPRTAFNHFSALWSTLLGIPGFYTPRWPPPPLQLDGTPEAVSLYDATPLKSTLERLVDFELINRQSVRLSIGAVSVRKGNSVYFDNAHERIGPEHVMASAALPPAFAPVTIDGEAYWDGGIVSNTPLQYVLDMRNRKSMLVFQVDLFNARGEVPSSLPEVYQRHKDILYSSRTRYSSDKVAQVMNTRRQLRDMLAELPESLRQARPVRQLAEALHTEPIDIVQLIYRQTPYELESKDYEFSRTSVLEHWQAGERDMCDTLTHPEWLKSVGIDDGVVQYDLIRHTRPV